MIVITNILNINLFYLKELHRERESKGMRDILKLGARNFLPVGERAQASGSSVSVFPGMLSGNGIRSGITRTKTTMRMGCQ